MIVVDANLLIYAYDAASLADRRPRTWLEEVFSGTEPVGLPGPSVAAFLRVMTKPKLHGRQYSLDEATGIIEAWMARTNVRILAPADDHWAAISENDSRGECIGAAVSDAELAALTPEYGGVLHTAEPGFREVSGVAVGEPADVIG